MLSLAVTLVVVFLSGSDALFPAVGDCTFMEYYCSAMRCNTNFVKDLQKDPSGDCGDKYRAFKSCVKSIIHQCVQDRQKESQMDGFVDQSYKQDTLCMEGSLEVPTPAPGVYLPCSSGFFAAGTNCSKAFHNKFTADKADPALCSEYAKGKKCLKDLIASDCNMPAEAQEVLDLVLSDYNPYCGDNRDPGATGNGQCYGVKILNGALSSSQIYKSLLVFALGLFLFLV